MSASNEDVERYQEDDTEKSVFTLRNLLICLGSLVALIVLLVLVWLGTARNANLSYLPSFSTMSNKNSPSDLVIFQHNKFIHVVDPKDSELKSRYLFDDADTFVSNFQFSIFKRQETLVFL